MKKINDAALCCEYLAIAASLAYSADCEDEMLAINTIMECMRLDIAELTRKHFPVVTKR